MCFCYSTMTRLYLSICFFLILFSSVIYLHFSFPTTFVSPYWAYTSTLSHFHNYLPGISLSHCAYTHRLLLCNASHFWNFETLLPHTQAQFLWVTLISLTLSIGLLRSSMAFGLFLVIRFYQFKKLAILKFLSYSKSFPSLKLFNFEALSIFSKELKGLSTFSGISQRGGTHTWT